MGCCSKADFASGKTASIYAEEEGLKGSTHLLIYDTGKLMGVDKLSNFKEATDNTYNYQLWS